MRQREKKEKTKMVQGIDMELMLEKLNEKKEPKKCGKIKLEKKK